MSINISQPISLVGKTGEYSDLLNIPAADGLSNVLAVSNYTGPNDILLNDNQRLLPVNGSSFLDLRDTTDGTVRLEGTNGLTLFAGPVNGYKGIHIDSVGRTIVGGNST